MAFGYPVFLELSGRRAVAIGEDAVRAGRGEALLDAGARVTVIAEGPRERLEALAGRGASVERRGYLPGDLAGAFLCVAASDDPSVRSSIVAEARARGVLVNVMDDVPNCDFAAPAVVRRGDLQIAVGTGGRSPALARRLREELSEQYGAEWTEAVGVIGDVRRDTLSALPDLGERARRWSAALDLEELLRLVREGRSAEAAGHLTARLLTEPAAAEPGQWDRVAGGAHVIGTVYLVGAGPGDPRLLTLRGAELLRRADVVVHDRLAPAALLGLAPATAEVVDVGKGPGRGPRQSQICELLVGRALRGLDVVRLKGGDPFVFGRGGEEALACARAGVPFEVVPGVSSAIAAPAAAGIPVTHRGVASSFAVVTAALEGGIDNELARVATAVDTLIVLMAAGRLARTCRAVVDAGRDPNEPAAAVQWATTPEQRTVAGTLATLPDLAAREGIGAPAALVIGPVVELAFVLGAAGPAGERSPHELGGHSGLARAPGTR